MSNDQYRSCITAVNACADACGQCAVACLFEPNRRDLARCIQLDMDCAELCRLAATYMSRGSELVHEVCELCASACEACAEECERHSMSHCRRCAKACRESAHECRAMTHDGRKAAASYGGKPATH